ncbi:hypothetical protein Ccrd_024484 [Cynara cardunculus var. scolymus]|uniref:Uncharacterized protein n=1 Tax=Cynara cardunculus var. scolymus TaxID=59895 RepID=A0A103XCD2_CYNCS|nr:hypothetical protein Ccrd_024484 [Cynara cardunculus var. scolymus]
MTGGERIDLHWNNAKEWRSDHSRLLVFVSYVLNKVSSEPQLLELDDSEENSETGKNLEEEKNWGLFSSTGYHKQRTLLIYLGQPFTRIQGSSLNTPSDSDLTIFCISVSGY